MSTVKPAVAGPSFLQSVTLVAEREVKSKLQSKVFVISTLVLFAVVLGGILLGGMFGGKPTTTQVAVTPDAQSSISNVQNLEVTQSADRAAAEQLVRDKTVTAAIVGDPASPTGVSVITLTDPNGSLMSKLSISPNSEILEPSATPPVLRYFVALGFGILFFMAAQTFGGTITQSVIEEKSTRVVEILISAISTRALLAGKVIGNTVLAMTQIIGLVVIAIIGLTATGQSQLLSLLGAPMIWFAVFFLFGFVLLAAMFSAAASMVSRQEDAGATTTPITLLVVAPYMLIIFFNDNPLVLSIMSYVPFSAPVGMPMRLFLGEAQWWEPLVSLAILIATAVVMITIGAKIYDNTLLRMGGRVSLKEALKG